MLHTAHVAAPNTFQQFAKYSTLIYIMACLILIWFTKCTLYKVSADQLPGADHTTIDQFVSA